MLMRLLMIFTLSLSLTPVCFADEAPSPEAEACAGSEDRAPCRYEDYDDVLRSGNCLDQICVAHCPSSAAEGTECTFIIGSGEERQGTCEEGLCSNLMDPTGEPTGGMESSGGETSLSDVLGNGGTDDTDMPAEEMENANSREGSEASDSEDEGCQQGMSTFGMAPFWLACLVALGFIRRRPALD